jgi:hypothetical protein
LNNSLFLQMSEDKETGWRAVGGAEEVRQKEIAAATTKEENDDEELQQRVQARAEDLGGEEASLITETEEGEVIPITETKYESPSKKARKTRKSSKSKAAIPKKDINLISMSKQLEKQSRQLARTEKVIQSIQSSYNKIYRQSNTMKQLYGVVTQLQRQMQRQIQQRQQRQRTQRKKGKDGITSPKK